MINTPIKKNTKGFGISFGLKMKSYMTVSQLYFISDNYLCVLSYSGCNSLICFTRNAFIFTNHLSFFIAHELGEFKLLDFLHNRREDYDIFYYILDYQYIGNVTSICKTCKFSTLACQCKSLVLSQICPEKRHNLNIIPCHNKLGTSSCTYKHIHTFTQLWLHSRQAIVHAVTLCCSHCSRVTCHVLVSLYILQMLPKKRFLQDYTISAYMLNKVLLVWTSSVAQWV